VGSDPPGSDPFCMPQDLKRYHRQYLYRPIGEEGQRKLCASRVTVIGCGALGTIIANTLARAGVGFIRIADRDFIEPNNLQRQVLFDEEAIAKNLPKAIAASERIKKINSQIVTEPIVTDVNFTNIENLIRDVDLVMDGTDNFETRFLINDACVKLGKPWVYAACIGSQGLTMTVIPQKTPCLRCVFETPPPAEMSPTCDTAGILAPAANVVASLACTEAIKWLSGNQKTISKNLYSFDVWNREAKALKLGKCEPRPDCPCCGQREWAYLKGSESLRAAVLCGRNSVQIMSGSAKSKVNFDHLSERLEKIGKVSFNRFMLRAEIDGFDLTVFEDGRTIIKGTSDLAQAKTIYAKYIGM